MLVHGQVEKILHEDLSKTFFVLKENDLIYHCLYEGKISLGESLDLEIKQESSYWKVESIYRNNSQKSIKKFLKESKLKGLGEKKIDFLIEQFGDKTLHVLEYESEKLFNLKSFKKEDVLIWSEKIRSFDRKEIDLFFLEQDLTKNFSKKIQKEYGEETLKKVKENPYDLAEKIKGVGFLKADEIGQKLGIDKNDERRVVGALWKVFSMIADEGHTKTSFQELFKRLKFFQVHLNKSTLDKLVEKKELIFYQGFYALKNYFFAEKFIASYLKSHLYKKNNLSENIDQLLNDSFLSEEQKKSIRFLLEKKIGILTGGPGTGKTTTLKTYLNILDFLEKKYLLASPTGRAAKRFSEVAGVEVKTIHRLLEWSGKKKRFLKNEKYPLTGDVLIIDESSMIDVLLFQDLLKAIPSHMQLLLVGDHEQLPSVGAGEVLRDLIESEKVFTAHLTQVFRQSVDSQIISASHSMLQKKMPHFSYPLQNKEAWKDDLIFIDSIEPTLEEEKIRKKWEEVQDIKFKNQFYDKIDFKNKDHSSNFLDLSEYSESLDYLKNKNIDEIIYRNYHDTTLKYNKTAKDTIIRLYHETLPSLYPNKKIQILTPMIKGSCGAQSLNETIQSFKKDNKSFRIGYKIFYEGDFVLQTRNNYDLDLFNGDLGEILKIEKDYLTIKFNERIIFYPKDSLKDLNLSYAMTVHKSQGSEFDIVIIPILTQHFVLLYRNLIYTALTRAKYKVVFVGTKKAFRMALFNIQKKTRGTFLKDFLC